MQEEKLMVKSKDKQGRATKKSKDSKAAEFLKLQKENESLKKEIEKLSDKQPSKRSLWRPITAGLFAVLAVVSIMLFNIAYWTRQTVLDNDQFVATMQPLIKDPAIQETLQKEITNELFSRINLEQEIKNNLPDNLDFIAGPFVGQVKGFTYNKIGDVLDSQQAYDVWTKTLTEGQKQIIAYVSDPKNNGEITISSIYQLASQNLGNSDISFLLNKNLPSKVGNIKLAELEGVPEARRALNLLDKATWQLALASIVFLALAIALAINKRKMVVGLAVFTLIFMVATLAALQLASTQVAGAVDTRYAAAAEATYKIITEPLATQTKGVAAFIAAILAIVLISSSWPFFVSLRSYFRKGLDWTTGLFAKNWALPDWAIWISQNKIVIGWTLVAVSFVAFALRLPPTTSGVTTALISSAICIFALEVFGSLSRVSKHKSVQ